MSPSAREGLLDGVVVILSLLIVGVVIRVAVFGVFSDSYLRVGMLLAGGFLILASSARRAAGLVDHLVLAATAAALTLGVLRYFRAAEEIETGLYFLSGTDIWMGFLGLAAVIELTRRSVGAIMASVTGLALVYGLWGDMAPGFLRHAGLSTDELQTVLWYSFDGVFGRPMATVVSTILIFIVFGALLELLGIDKVLVRLAMAATARLRAGPAAAALLASLAKGQLILSLIVMALACLLLGMGMPTVPAYLIIVLVMGTSLQHLGAPIVHTHLFVLYFGVLSAITPPVALAAFAAAPIAGTGPMAAALMPSAALAKRLLRMSTLGPGTSPNLVMTTFGNIVNRELPDYEIQVNATGTATRHVLEVAMGRTDFCMSSPALHALMSGGRAMFQNIEEAPELATRLRTVFNFPMGVYHIAVYESSGITSLDQIAGKRVFLGPPGGAAYATMSRLIQAVTDKEANTDYTAVSLGWDAAAASFQDGNIDVYCNPTILPSPVFTQILVTNRVRFLGIPAEKLEDEAVQALARRPGFGLGVLPQGIYGPNQVNDADATTLRVTVGVVTNADEDADMIYQMTRTSFDGVAEMRDSAPWLASVTPEGAVQDINVPLHPGALRALEELGVQIPDAARP